MAKCKPIVFEIKVDMRKAKLNVLTVQNIDAHDYLSHIRTPCSRQYTLGKKNEGKNKYYFTLQSDT